MKETFEEHWPISSLHVTCRSCGKVLYSGSDFAIDTPSYVNKLVIACASKHEESSGHIGTNVGIKTTETVMKVENTITVSDV